MKEKLGVGCVLALVLTLVLSAVGGAIALAMLIEVDDGGTVVGTGPFAGEKDVIIDLTGTTDGTRDAEVLVRRLEALGIRTDLKLANYGWIQIELDDVTGREAIEPLLAVGRFEVCPVAADQSALSEEHLGTLPPQVTRTHTALGRLTLRAPSEEALSPVIAMLPSGTGRIFCDRECEVVIVESATITSRDIVSAAAGVDEKANAIVSAELDSNGAARFETMTSSRVGEEIALVLDGRVLAMPVVAEPIAGGRLSFIVAQPERAHTIAAILAGRDELYGAWTITSFVEEP